MHTLLIVPSWDVHFLILCPIGAEVAWHVVLRSLQSHMGAYYLARLIGY